MEGPEGIRGANRLKVRNPSSVGDVGGAILPCGDGRGGAEEGVTGRAGRRRRMKVLGCWRTG